MLVNSKNISWKVWFLQWILVNAVSWGIGLTVMEFASNSFGMVTNLIAALAEVIVAVIGFCFAGIVIGLSQWFFLQ